MRATHVTAVVAALGIGASLLSGLSFAAGGILITLEYTQSNPEPKRPTSPIHTLRDLDRALLACWKPAPLDNARQQVDVIFEVSFKRSGELFGKPRVVKFSRDVTPEERGFYYALVAAAIDRCSQMPFTESMGGAVAGRVLRIRLIDGRNRKQARVSWLTTTTS